MQRDRPALATAFLLCVWLRQAARAVSLIYLTAVRQGKTPHTTPQA